MLEIKLGFLRSFGCILVKENVNRFTRIYDSLNEACLMQCVTFFSIGIDVFSLELKETWIIHQHQ